MKIINFWKTIVQKISKLVLLPEYILVTLKQSLRQLPSNDRTVVLTLDDDRLYKEMDGNGRYVFGVIQMFHDGGYNVYFCKKIDFLTYTRLGRFGRLIYAFKNVKIVPDLPKKTEQMIYVFDTVYPKALGRSWKHSIFVNLEKSPSCRWGESITIPYSLHPLIYQCAPPNKIDIFRNNKRNLRLLFTGSTQRYYSNHAKISPYGLLTRSEDLKGLSEIGQRIKTLKTVSDLKTVINNEHYLNEGVIFKTDGKDRIQWDEWLSIISCSDFFVCFCGSDYPMCHNAIESIAVGTIPIISYHDWFTPKLEHKKNAIIYSGKEDLALKIHEVFAMSADEIKVMSKNVMQYYDEHLSARSFIKKFDSKAKEINTLILLPCLIPTDAEQRESSRTMEALKAHFKKGI